MKKKVLFIDRDGTIIKEPPIDFQVDSLEKLEFVPKVIKNLFRLRNLNEYEMVIVSNQDGLGTPSYPSAAFELVQNKMLNILNGEGVFFDDMFFDPSFPEDNSPNRKPQTGMLTKYLSKEYDLAHSFVIGDRLTDIELAKNLGAQGILLKDLSELPLIGLEPMKDSCRLMSNDWDEISSFIVNTTYSSIVVRETSETKIKAKINLFGESKSVINTGLGFFDHMLDQIPRHSGVNLEIIAHGDLQVDEHHTVEDTAIALGEALRMATLNCKGLERYGFCLPMDESEAKVVLDFGGRIDFWWDVTFQRERIGDVPCELFSHFFKSLAESAKVNLHIEAHGSNEHHKIEAIFKAFARALKAAIRRDNFSFNIPSTKGSL